MSDKIIVEKELKKKIRFEQEVLAILSLQQAPHDLVYEVEKILAKDVEELSKIKEQNNGNKGTED